MRAGTLVMLSASIAIVVLSGCSGDGVDYHSLTGNYFPVATGSQWTYDMQVTTYFLTQILDARGQSTRVVANNTLYTALRSALLRTTTFTDYFPDIPTPDVAASPDSTIYRYCDYLFSSGGGLQDWSEYFRSYDDDHNGTTDAVLRWSSGAPRAVAVLVPETRPFLRSPLIAGEAANVSGPLTTIPFYTNNETLSGTTTVLGIQYREPESFLGLAAASYVTYVQTLQATVNFEGHQGTCNGYAKTDIVRDIGPYRKDIDLEFQIDGGRVRLHVYMVATSFEQADE